MDTDLLWFGVWMWDVRVTGLMQGPVYGLQTEDSDLDIRLRTLFNYFAHPTRLGGPVSLAEDNPLSKGGRPGRGRSVPRGVRAVQDHRTDDTA